jgi:hypothetical protein
VPTRLRRVLALSLGALLLGAALDGESAWAENGSADAICGQSTCSAHARESPSATPPTTRPAADNRPPTTVCEYYEDGPGAGSDAGDVFLADTAKLKIGDTVWVQCHDTAGDNYQPAYRTTWGANGTALPPAINIAREAVTHLEFGAPTIESWPSPGNHLVGVRSYFHVANFPALADRRTADTGGVQATVSAVPIRTIWHLGTNRDNTPIRLDCTGPGTIWTPGTDDKDPNLCGTTFWSDTAGDITATVDIVYRVDWTSSTGEGGTLPLPPQPAPFPLHIRQIQAVGH